MAPEGDPHRETTRPASKDRDAVDFFFFHTSPTFSAARESIAVISGSGSDNATTPEGGNAAGSSSPERESSPSDAAIDIWSSGEAPKETGGVPRSAEVPARSNGNLTGCGALEGWGTPLGKPSPWPSITSDSTGYSATPGARTNAESRQRQRDSAMFDTAESIRNSQMVMSPFLFFSFFSFEEEHEPPTKASSACWMPRHVRQRSWPSWAPGNDHTQKRTGDKTSLKIRDHPWYSFREIALSEKCSFSAEARRGAGHRTLLVWLSAGRWSPARRDHRCCAVTAALVRRTLSVEGESSSFNHYRSAPKRKDELMRCTCCLLYSRGDQRQLDAMIACQCPLARLVTLEVDRSLWRDPNFVGHPTWLGVTDWKGTGVFGLWRRSLRCYLRLLETFSGFWLANMV